MTNGKKMPRAIAVSGVRVHNFKGIDISVPLGKLVGVAALSGPDKSSLMLGMLYAEGSRRYLKALSTDTRRILSQSPRPVVDSIEHVPAALALPTATASSSQLRSKAMTGKGKMR